MIKTSKHKITLLLLVTVIIALYCVSMAIGHNVAYAQENEIATAEVVWGGTFGSAYGDDLAELTATTQVEIDGEEKEITLNIIGLPNDSDKDEKGNYKVGRYHIEAVFNEEDRDYASYSIYTLRGAYEVYIISDTSLEKEIESLKKQIVEYEVQIKNLQDTIENLTTKIGTLEDNNQQLQGEVTKLQTDIGKLQDKIETLQKSITGLGGDNSNMELQIAELQSVVTQLQSANTALKEQIALVQIGLQSKLDMLQGKLDSANSINLELQEQIEDLQSDILGLSRRVTNQGKLLSGSVAISIVLLILLILLVGAVVLGYLIMVGKIKLPQLSVKQEESPQAHSSQEMEIPSVTSKEIKELEKAHTEELTQLGRGLATTLKYIEHANRVAQNSGNVEEISEAIRNVKAVLLDSVPDFFPTGEEFNEEEMEGDGTNYGRYVAKIKHPGKKLGRSVIQRAEVVRKEEK